MCVRSRTRSRGHHPFFFPCFSFFRALLSCDICFAAYLPARYTTDYFSSPFPASLRIRSARCLSSPTRTVSALRCCWYTLGITSVSKVPCLYNVAHLSLESPGNTWVRKVYPPVYRSLTRVQEAQPRLFTGSPGCTQHLHIFFPLLYRWFVGVQSTRRPLYSYLFSSIFSALGGVPTCLSSALQPWESLRSGRALFLCGTFYRSLTSTSALVCLLQSALAARRWVV